MERDRPARRGELRRGAGRRSVPSSSWNRDGWFVGWQAQREVAHGLTLGGEVFHGTSRRAGQPGETRFDVGVILDLGELHHVLFSIGRGLGTNAAQGYLAYQPTFGPREDGAR